MCLQASNFDAPRDMKKDQEPASLFIRVSTTFLITFSDISMLGSIFANSNLSYREVLELMWFFSHDCTYEECMLDIENPSSNTTLSANTLYDWFHNFRVAISDQMRDWTEDEGLIGGDGI